ncbi:MAG: YlzJ-like family protein [Bacillota bacterium]|nr:YlzJ-like family protein [Bacillota bacterium]
MVLYTIVPEEIVFQSKEEICASQEIVYNGKRVLVQPIDFKSFKIVQLISSDPSDFLLTDFQPGSIITLTM